MIQEKRLLQCLTCPVCLQFLNDPLQDTNAHTFCRDCVHTLKFCPVCRQSVKWLPNRFAANVLECLSVECQFCGSKKKHIDKTHFKQCSMLRERLAYVVSKEKRVLDQFIGRHLERTHPIIYEMFGDWEWLVEVNKDWKWWWWQSCAWWKTSCKECNRLWHQEQPKLLAFQKQRVRLLNLIKKSDGFKGRTDF